MAGSTKKTFNFIADLRAGCEAMGLPPVNTTAEQDLYSYFQELKHWSRKINLIAKGATDEEILEKHFLDSLTLLPLLQGNGVHLLDIGTGAGFPGLVCKTACPDLHVTLVEPRLKRISFLRHMVRTLKLTGIDILDCRVEDEEMLPSAGGYSHIVSRAVSDIKIFMDMGARFVKPGVQVICMKGPKWKEELTIWQEKGQTDHMVFDRQTRYKLPKSAASRHLLIFTKGL